jgi:pimeloyl-ACP methyl ester carboxylesterase
MIDRGSGSAIVLIPGVQGRWEWMRPTVEALARRARVVSYSLCGEPGSAMGVDPALGFDGFVEQLDGVIDRAGLDRVTLCGVSFGGPIAVRYAARRPRRVAALVIASAPGPGWRPDPRASQYLRAPRLLSPLFVLRAPARLNAEVRAAFPGVGDRLSFGVRQLVRVARAPIRPSLMAGRIRLMLATDLVESCRAVEAPTLVITGDAALDRVVPVASTREYVAAIAGASAVTLERTGHIGSVTRPDRFADLVATFADAAARPRARRA